ncbi:MAG: hypothetical protein A2Z91_03145 [Deltaproteobacteria bacterium GWA2_38_16]|nr:MAG: hypothetical protein A2Z91_03145 [Deltaproteobacteria bacterium GWA2_38_16]OGQ02882.1 MAG: hypothetical protein A3D19_06570 [Deltaproteobacteria bacterium RIFCSPHIGHO2_02_FULL_38_15]OGQ35102.1 MAG: hypothetical protein A3A72_03610 [Deltaproteobacteria bacterium RIFCSPLOWO2_01_FULL_38_9]HBQ21728.1 hypothetical protein [Deltaproteobacteria bacterium]
MKNRVFIVLFFTAFCFVNVSLAAEVVYRCWSYNAGGFSSIRAMRCTNPALTLFPSGQYQLGSEKGTYKIKNGKLILSESKIRGEGKFLENDNQIQFEYDYKGAHHTLTYLLQRGSLSELKEPSSNREVASITPSYITKVELILDFSGQTKSLGWINAVKLVPQGEGDSAESIAYQDNEDRSKIISVFHEKVKSGAIYTIYVSSGFDTKAIGTIDLRDAKGTIKKVIPARASW